HHVGVVERSVHNGVAVIQHDPGNNVILVRAAHHPHRKHKVEGLALVPDVVFGPLDDDPAGVDVKGLAGGPGTLQALVVHRCGPVGHRTPGVQDGLGVGHACPALHLCPGSAIDAALDDIACHRAVRVGGGGQGDFQLVADIDVVHSNARRGGRLVGDDGLYSAGYPGIGGKAHIILRPDTHLQRFVLVFRHGQRGRHGGGGGQRLPAAAVVAILVGVRDGAAKGLAGVGGQADGDGGAVVDVVRHRHGGGVYLVGALPDVVVAAVLVVRWIVAAAGVGTLVEVGALDIVIVELLIGFVVIVCCF